MKIFLSILLIIGSLMAELKTAQASKEIVNSGIKIIDIRTEREWKETGIVKGSITITFFDENGNYDAQKFLNEINKHISKDKEFALICRTGNRTTAVSQFLSDQGYKVTNLKGGIRHLIDKEGYQAAPYDK